MHPAGAAASSQGGVLRGFCLGESRKSSWLHCRVEVQFGADTAAQCRTVTACRKKLEALEKRRKSQHGQDLGFDQDADANLIRCPTLAQVGRSHFFNTSISTERVKDCDKSLCLPAFPFGLPDYLVCPPCVCYSVLQWHRFIVSCYFCKGFE